MPTIARTAASITGLVAVFLLVLYLAYGSGNGGDPNATPAPSAAVAASPTARPQVTAPPHPPGATPYSPDSLDSPAAVPLRQGERVDLPDRVALIFGRGCDLCEEGQYAAIVRVYRDATGDVRIDQLFPPPGWEEMRVTSVATSRGGSMLAITSCPAAGCDGQTPPADQTLYVSIDGGVTWEEWETLGADTFVAMAQHVSASEGIEFDQVVVGRRPASPGADYTFMAIPGWLPPHETSIPGDAYQGVVPGVGPIWLRPRDEFIPTNSLMDLYGSPYRNFDDSVSLRLLSVSYFRFSEAQTFEESSNTGGKLEYRVEFGHPLGTGPAPDKVFTWPARIRVFREVGLSALIGDAGIDPVKAGLDESRPLNVPVIVDDLRRKVSPITDFLTPEFLDHRYDLLTVREGAFARVNVGSGCLYVHSSPGLDAEIVGCASNEVLLVHSNHFKEQDETEWLAVRAPDGTSGWAATEFLEY